ncbi:heavy-metal-associated domain-containing protein [Deinococcus rubellus]|uniref:Heavy-metal-associated domain-containing protein n=1 Tax=Deinococcus rubellus TaxID=1889240 RepID=A0ABY5YI20_9DEIO|nr:heavy metal-associated domain-containing protein [Deinococcus rubellus]UWX63443.1 heavy-metal-associated domain-containing protein [Deinococcus rubellus]
MTQSSQMPGGPELDHTDLTVGGMTCDHCVRAVTQALKGVLGVKEASVDLSSGLARVRGEADPQALLDAVKEEGYTAALRE